MTGRPILAFPRCSNGAIRLPVDVLAVDQNGNCSPSDLQIPNVAYRLNGRKVRLKGVMIPPFKGTGLTKFYFAPETKRRPSTFMSPMPLHASIDVQLREGHSVDYTGRPFEIEGALRIQVLSDEDGVYALYWLDNAIVIQNDVRLSYWPAYSAFGC